MKKKKRASRTLPPDPIDEFREWGEHQYSKGYYLTKYTMRGKPHPRAGARGNPKAAAIFQFVLAGMFLLTEILIFVSKWASGSLIILTNCRFLATIKVSYFISEGDVNP